MTSERNGDPGEYYTSRRSKKRRAEHRRWDRRAQIGALLLAAAAGVVAGMLGTHRSWEHPASTPSPATHPSVAHRP
jgi:hypothetical protein